jgi:ACS family hexuronate transporter-like MFS transporter
MSDVFPKKVTASVSGLGGFAGAMGGVIAPLLIGSALQGTGAEGYSNQREICEVLING